MVIASDIGRLGFDGIPDIKVCDMLCAIPSKNKNKKFINFIENYPYSQV